MAPFERQIALGTRVDGVSAFDLCGNGNKRILVINLAHRVAANGQPKEEP